MQCVDTEVIAYIAWACMPGSERVSCQSLRVTGPELGKDLATDLSLTFPAASVRRRLAVWL